MAQNFICGLFLIIMALWNLNHTKACDCEQIRSDLVQLKNFATTILEKTEHSQLPQFSQSNQNEQTYPALKPIEPIKYNDDAALRFHAEKHGRNVLIQNNGLKAVKINCTNTSPTVITNRPLKTDELFEVRLDRFCNLDRHVQIGVTLRSPEELSFESCMYHERGGTWILREDFFSYNGNITKFNYGPDLRSLNVGDRLGIMRKSNSTLHVFVNGVDQGTADGGVPERIFGFVDLFGNVDEVSIVSRFLEP